MVCMWLSTFDRRWDDVDRSDVPSLDFSGVRRPPRTIGATLQSPYSLNWPIVTCMAHLYGALIDPGDDATAFIYEICYSLSVIEREIRWLNCSCQSAHSLGGVDAKYYERAIDLKLIH